MDVPQTQLEALLTRSAFAPIHNVGWIRVTGEDRVRWLNGMVTNSITALKPGEGCYNFFLNAQGRIQGDCTAWMREDSILLETASAGRLATMLDHFIIMDDVELTVLSHGSVEASPSHDRSGTITPKAGLTVLGKQAEAVLTGIDLRPGSELCFEQLPWRGESVDLLHQDGPLAPRFEVWSDPATIGLLMEALRQQGAVEAGAGQIEQLRLLEGMPLYGVDIRDKELPQETNQTRALHFSKGCYLGQEIVERIRSRGQVNRLFQAFTLTGSLPEAGAVLTANDKPVGEITSVGEVPGHGILALGYVRRAPLETKAVLTYPGGTAAVRNPGFGQY